MIERVFLDGAGKCLVCKCELQGMSPQPKYNVKETKDAARGGGGGSEEGLRKKKKKSSCEYALADNQVSTYDGRDECPHV